MLQSELAITIVHYMAVIANAVIVAYVIKSLVETYKKNKALKRCHQKATTVMTATISQYAKAYDLSVAALRSRVRRKGIQHHSVGDSRTSYARVFDIKDLHLAAKGLKRIGQEPLSVKPCTPTHEEMQQRIIEAAKKNYDLADYSHCPPSKCNGNDICKSCLRNPLNFPAGTPLTMWDQPTKIKDDKCTHYQGFTASMKAAHTLYEPVEG